MPYNTGTLGVIRHFTVQSKSVTETSAQYKYIPGTRYLVALIGAAVALSGHIDCKVHQVVRVYCCLPSIELVSFLSKHEESVRTLGVLDVDG